MMEVYFFIERKLRRVLTAKCSELVDLFVKISSSFRGLDLVLFRKVVAND